MKYLIFILFFFIFIPVASFSGTISPEEIIRDSRIDLLYDEIYYFPAFKSQKENTVYLPLRKWDIIFAGFDLNLTDESNLSPDIYNIAAGIPGVFDHAMVYLGKDSSGNAYLVELAINILNNNDDSYLKLLNFGMDFGYFMPDASYSKINKNSYGIIWAKTFREDLRIKLKINEDQLIARVKTDLINKFPYQLSYKYSENFLDSKIYLVDDGLQGGGTCVDYWLAIFEEYSEICFKNVRISPDELKDYFINNPLGKTVYIPETLNFLNFKLYIHELLLSGFNIIPDKPHTYFCDGSNSTGIILPDLIYENENLLDIPETSKKKGLIEVLAEHNLSLKILRKLIKGALNNNY